MACSAQNDNNPPIMANDTSNWNSLTEEETRIIVHKGTEYPFTGVYNDHKAEGVYVCKRCNTPLFKSEDKFNSGSGWPSFDDAIGSNVKEVPDTDGRRVEIVCGTCDGHLGHVFRGEHMTDKNTRHCVNSLSLDFVADSNAVPMDTAIFASGCFWGTEYYLQQKEGVISTEVGYIGGHVKHPSYREVCSGTTGHAEATRVVYNPDKISFEELAKFFFETHDPTQVNRQGPDIGEQYRSEVFYLNEEQKAITEKLIAELELKGLDIATKVTPATTFWKAEDYHQDYYNNKGGVPYCHKYTKRF
jgi:peptide methionine sulfoxide reductase msrA/msrB